MRGAAWDKWPDHAVIVFGEPGVSEEPLAAIREIQRKMGFNAQQATAFLIGMGYGTYLRQNEQRPTMPCCAGGAHGGHASDCPAVSGIARTGPSLISGHQRVDP